MMTNENHTTISVVMPAYNATHHLEASLPPLVAMRDRGEVLEVVVVDDQSTDDTAEYARSLGATVLQTPKNGGPGLARNLAARHVKGDVIWLVDADVIAHEGGPDKIKNAMADPSVVALFGSYCDNPPAQGFFSQYKNLVHRFYHQRGNQEASTFWAGCGAIRTKQYLDAGGFDTEGYAVPSIEDIELGYRLRDRGGRILLIHDLKGTHLKDWSLSNVVHTDIFRRAIPWSRLMLARGGLTDDLNTSKLERLRAVYAALFFASFLAPILSVGLWWAPLAAFVGAVAVNWKLFSFFSACKGPFYAVGALLFHQVYYVYSTAAYAFCWIEAKLGLNLNIGQVAAKREAAE